MIKKLILLLIFFILLPVKTFALDSVDINNASLQQLDEITDVGPATAQKIVNSRPFSSVDDLLKVKGIGPKTLQKIKNQGVACVNCQTKISQTQNIITTTSPAIATTAITQITYPKGVYINEILPNPAGADETNEWIELYNSNNFSVDLSGWMLRDLTGTVTNFTIPQNTEIAANGFLVFKRPDTNIMLNNDNDGLNLLTPDSAVYDSMNFASAPLNQSYNKTDSGWQWSITLTPGSENIITTFAAAVKSATATLSKTKNSVKSNNIEAGLANISQATDVSQEKNKSSSPWFLFLSALAITVILASLVLFIKLKFQKNVRT